MKKLGYFWVLTLFAPDNNDVCYKVPVYNCIGSRNLRRAERACEKINDELARKCEEIRKAGYTPEKIAVCVSGIYVSGKNNNGRTKTVRV